MRSRVPNVCRMRGAWGVLYLCVYLRRRCTSFTVSRRTNGLFNSRLEDYANSIFPQETIVHYYVCLNNDYVMKCRSKTSDLPVKVYSRWEGRITENQCLTMSGFRRSRFDVFFFLSFIILRKGRVTGATDIVSSFDRKIIVQWRSGIYPTYIPNPEIALGIVQTYRNVLSCKRFRMRKKMCRWKSSKYNDTEDHSSVSQNLSTFYHIILVFISVFLRCMIERNIWNLNLRIFFRFIW